MKIKWKLKDIIIVLIILLIITSVAIAIFQTKDSILTKSFSFVGAIVTLLFGIIGIFQFCYENGLNFLVLTSYTEMKKKNNLIQIKKNIDEFFRNECCYFSQYDFRRISYFMEQLGISKNKFDEIKLDIIKARLMPLASLEDAKDKLKTLLLNDLIIIDQSKYPSNEIVYKKVKYFINLMDLMYSKEYCDEIVDILCLFITHVLGDDIHDINKIVIPTNSNFLLGFEISKKLAIPVVKMIESPRIFSKQYWDGNFSHKDRYKTIIIHDVLVTADQIIKSISLLPENCSVESVFCIISRETEFNGIKKLEEKGYSGKVHCLFSLSDSDIEKMVVLKNDPQ